MFIRHLKLYTQITIRDKIIKSFSQILACETEIQTLLYYPGFILYEKQDFLRIIAKAFKCVFLLAEEV
jgi:hypothetical protein